MGTSLAARYMVVQRIQIKRRADDLIIALRSLLTEEGLPLLSEELLQLNTEY